MQANPFESIKNLTENPSFDFLQQLGNTTENNNESYDFFDLQNEDSPYSNIKISCNYFDIDHLNQKLQKKWQCNFHVV